jgi:hypothetical protein
MFTVAEQKSRMEVSQKHKWIPWRCDVLWQHEWSAWLLGELYALHALIIGSEGRLCCLEWHMSSKSGRMAHILESEGLANFQSRRSSWTFPVLRSKNADPFSNVPTWAFEVLRNTVARQKCKSAFCYSRLGAVLSDSKTQLVVSVHGFLH